MNFESGEIYTLKLTSGEEITCKVFNRFADYVEVTQPISMVLGPQGLQMMPSLFSANQDRNVHINTATIVMQAETREDVKAKYIEATTGIATPPAKQIITG